MSDDSAAIVIERLRELACPELYQRNAFRTTGLVTAATGPQIRRRKQQVMTAAAAGLFLPDAAELPLPDQPSADQYRSAFDIIDHPQRRITDEALWLWGEPASGSCGCAAEVHHAHDAAVRLHTMVLDAELDGRSIPNTGAGSWRAAALAWRTALQNPGFGDHLRHRIGAIHDFRLIPSAATTLEIGLPEALVVPALVLTIRASGKKRFSAALREWDWADERRVGQAAERILGPTLAATERAIESARKQLATDPAGAGNILRSKVLPKLQQSRAFAYDAVTSRVSRLSDEVALLLNNCAVALLELELGARSDIEAAALLADAKKLATTGSVRRLVTTNTVALKERAEAHEQQQAVKNVVVCLGSVAADLERGQPRKAAAHLEHDVVSVVEHLRLSKIDEARKVGVHLADQTALLLNNCAVALSPGDAVPSSESIRLLDLAERLSQQDETTSLIRRNRRELSAAMEMWGLGVRPRSGPPQDYLPAGGRAALERMAARFSSSDLAYGAAVMVIAIIALIDWLVG